MDKAERLLDLVALLLHTREPLSFEEIQHAFPEDYGQGHEDAIARKFERDKADILALGLPLKLCLGDEYEKEGYLIERQRYGQPALDLGPEELALLFLAGSAALDLEGSPFQRDLVLALNKISLATSPEGGARSVRSVPLARSAPTAGLRQREHLEVLRRAIAERKLVTLTYHGLWKDEITQRKVHPYGLVYRRGVWILVAHCQLRDAVRLFHVDRIRGLAVNPLKPRSPDFEWPAGFELTAHVPREPWQLRAHPPVRAVLRFEPPVAEAAAAELGPEALEVREEGEARVVSLECTSLEGLLPTLLAYRGRAVALEPPELRALARAALARLAGEGQP
ncbi:MAG TPA: WYL domain-containing protein [Myxococcota bacterium]|nr:WYL domain-containing protein [Myxococcota bacterium]HRY92348.1 WYL domain-containing protein [Myxococcota bacterium]HSA22883.1 WYL domain-containing protein [Myxococcota bacterium]